MRDDQTHRIYIALMCTLIALLSASLSGWPSIESFEQKGPTPVRKPSELESARMEVESATRVTIAANVKANEAAARAATAPITALKTEAAARALDAAVYAQATQDAANARLVLVASGEEYRRLAAKALPTDTRRSSEATDQNLPHVWEARTHGVRTTSPTPSRARVRLYEMWTHTGLKSIFAWSVLALSIVLTFALGYGVGRRAARNTCKHLTPQVATYSSTRVPESISFPYRSTLSGPP